MHRFPAWLLAWTCLLSASPISAGVLTNATWVQTAILDSFPLSRSANDSRWAYFGSGTSTSLAVEIDYFPMSTIIGVPKTPNGPLDLGIELTQGGTQIINATPWNAFATMGITGRQVVAGGLPLHVGHGINQSMFRLGASTIVSIPANPRSLDSAASSRRRRTISSSPVRHSLRPSPMPTATVYATWPIAAPRPPQARPSTCSVAHSINSAGPSMRVRAGAGPSACGPIG
jgi:hypothetical protein